MHVHNRCHRHPETLVGLTVLFSDGLDKSISNKGVSRIGYIVDWCVNHGLQSIQFVSRPVEEEKEPKKIPVRLISVCSTSGVC